MFYKYAVLVAFKSLQNYLKKVCKMMGNMTVNAKVNGIFKPLFLPQNYLRWTGKNYFTGDACFTVLEMWYH